jgi:hypothetical protein
VFFLGKLFRVRLALDGEFTLSVRFLNAVYAKGGPVIASSDARRTVIPGLKDGELLHIVEGIFLDEEKVIDIGREVKPLTGLWDLPMIGAEELDVEHEYQMLTGGSPVDSACLEGPFVYDGENYWQLLEHFSNNEYSKPGDIKEPWTNPANFYPAASLPSDAVLVVRPDSLAKLIARVQPDQQSEASTSGGEAVEPTVSEKRRQRAGGRRMSNLWPDWVAELVLHLHNNGFPDGDGAAGQDALIAAVEEQLIQRGREAPSRSTVQDTVRAVLVRYRAAGN